MPFVTVCTWWFVRHIKWLISPMTREPSQQTLYKREDYINETDCWENHATMIWKIIYVHISKLHSFNKASKSSGFTHLCHLPCFESVIGGSAHLRDVTLTFLVYAKTKNSRELLSIAQQSYCLTCNGTVFKEFERIDNIQQLLKQLLYSYF